MDRPNVPYKEWNSGISWLEQISSKFFARRFFCPEEERDFRPKFEFHFFVSQSETEINGVIILMFGGTFFCKRRLRSDLLM